MKTPKEYAFTYGPPVIEAYTVEGFKVAMREAWLAGRDAAYNALRWCFEGTSSEDQFEEDKLALQMPKELE